MGLLESGKHTGGGSQTVQSPVAAIKFLSFRVRENQVWRVRKERRAGTGKLKAIIIYKLVILRVQGGRGERSGVGGPVGSYMGENMSKYCCVRTALARNHDSRNRQESQLILGPAIHLSLRLSSPTNSA